MMEVSNRERTETVNLEPETSTLSVEICDALSERDKVKFTVRSKSNVPPFDAADGVRVVRLHEEFVWLHQAIEDEAAYAGYLIPPAPPKPNFDASRDKLQHLGQIENTMTIEEFNKLKAELEAEYLVTFKKTVAMHEMFLKRLAKHQVFREDRTFQIFLTYADSLDVRGKNKKERLAGLFSSLGKSADGYLLANTQKDIDEHFDKHRSFLTRYSEQVREATTKAAKMTASQKSLADSYINVVAQITALGPLEMNNDLEVFLPKMAAALESHRKVEGRLSSDSDLKLTDILRYYQQDSGAARALLNRRLRALADYESANRNQQKARLKNKDVQAAEKIQREACERFESISGRAKLELDDLGKRRVASFQKYLIEHAETQKKHCETSIAQLRESIIGMKSHVIRTN